MLNITEIGYTPPSSYALDVSNIRFEKVSPPSSYFDGTYDAVFIPTLVNTFNSENYNKIKITIDGAADAQSFKYQISKRSSLTGNYTWPSTWITVASGKTVTLENLDNNSYYKVRVQTFSGANATGTAGPVFEDRNRIYISNGNKVAKSNHSAAATLRNPKSKQKEPDSYRKNPDAATKTNSAPIYSSDRDSHASAYNSLQKFYENKNEKIQKGFFVLENPNKDPKSVALAYRSFPQIVTNTTETISTDQPSGVWRHFIFGTSFYMTRTEDSMSSCAFGFFVGGFGDDGYYIRIDTVPYNVNDEKKRVIRVLKLMGGKQTLVSDNQDLFEDAFVYTQEAKVYKVDIAVKHTPSVKNVIKFSVNGRTFTAVDESNPLTPTNTIAMASFTGKINFDYVYGKAVSGTVYNNSLSENIYNGRMSNDILNMFFGDVLLDNQEAINELYWLKNAGAVDDFGASVKQLKEYKIQFDEGLPATKPFATAGADNKISIIAQKHNNFSSKFYVINNTSFPVSTSGVKVIGNKISKNSSALRYSDSEEDEYIKESPVVLNTSWIQDESDIIELSKWIKSYWSKNNSQVDIEIFGNPLLMVGDIITIDYNRVDLSSSQKFVIIEVNQTFSGGLTTRLTCVSI